METEQIARFGTYGRGFWDFQIEEQQPVATNEPNLIQGKLKVFPNPSMGDLNIELPAYEASNASIKVYSLNGQLFFSESYANQNIANDLIQLVKATG